jgi:replicative DNA helicase
VPFKKLKENIALIQQAGSEYKNQPLYIADISNNSIDHISGLIRNAYIRYGIKIAVIDYLQLLGDRTQRSREQEVGKVTRALKNLAKELKITVIALSQLSRPKIAGQHYPTMSRLRDSGQIEEAADVIIFIYRPEVYGIEEYEGDDSSGVAEIVMAKGRNYGTGRFKSRFEETTTRFIDGFTQSFNRDASGASENETPF